MTEFRRATRLEGLELSEIVQVSEAARAMRAEGHDVVALSTGEPDFPTPDHVIEAAHQAALDGDTNYTPTGGTVALRAVVARGAGVDMSQTVISTGAKQVIANAMLATLDEGDEVVIPVPYWTTYSDVVRMSGGTPVLVECPMEAGFRLTPEQLEAAITPRTKWLMLNAPSNPSGAVYDEDQIRALAEVLERHPHVWIMADEIYEHLSFVPFTSFREAAPELEGRTLIVNGVSKAYSMTGWRIGWGIGPAPLIKAMTAVQGQVTSGASSISQAAAVAALTGDQSLLAERCKVMKARRDKVVAGLDALSGIRCPVPDGAFYAFPNIEEAMAAGGFKSDAEFCRALLEREALALVPGRAFGLPGHVRLSFAYAEASLDEGIARMGRFVESLG
ncbi:pyridoxal phosphate-dependent aminotransferase [Roseovarius sp. SCSIO 43702]|uniref:pyridoxal phosphate-dependent aminotransferase n=1 Tax=Roseovarius sp. SCSIO 43702 TaxID=2823043 RepID=UPI001C731B85|nr:pyridoxal phosphate-dependent aminotransferase [Roseovarius sp. SCSIO 43702]QYX55570.1 pyridoxal phosphate-dependent aminotransferase [Roseovarius sp. SCSIO 43702]